MSGELSGRIALVTGGGRGIGRAISLRLAAEGAHVVVNYRRDAEAAERTVADIAAAGGRATACQGSVADWDDLCSLVAFIQEHVGTVDALVHNGGVASRGLDVVDTEPDELVRVLHTHAVGPHLLSKLLLPGMREQGRGDIVMISSIATDLCEAGGAPYVMGKLAMEGLAYTLAKEEAQHGIRVNVVAPGLVTTDMGDRLAQALSGKAGAGDLDAAMMLGRVSRPEDIAEAVLFFLSSRSRQITGQRLAVDGGRFRADRKVSA